MSSIDTGHPMKWDVGSSVLSISVSYDGKHIVTGSRDLCVWDVRNGGLILGPLNRHAGWVWSVAFSPDNSYIVSGSDDNTICILNASTGDPISQPLQEHTGTIRSLAFSPNSSHIVSGSDDCTIRIWDVRTGDSIGEPIREHTKSVRSVAYSPNSALIISGSDDLTICIWDATTRTLVRKIHPGHTGMVLSVAFSPNSSQIVSGSSDCTTRVWDVNTGNPIFEPLKGHTKQVNSVAFSPDSVYIISGSDDRTICIWDACTGNPTCQPLQRHTGSVQSVAFSSDSTQVISGSLDSTVCIWKGLRNALLAPQNSNLVDIVSSKMTMQETFARLLKHGCIDLSASIVITGDSHDALDSGGFGVVRRALLIDGRLVAIKTLRQQHLPKSTDKGTKRAAREIYIWSKLQHPNVQVLLGVAIFQRELGMVSPWMEQGNLVKYLRGNPNVERYPLCVQLASGVSYLHNIGTVHGDLKANNVLVSKDGELKITDFDHAILSESTLRFSTTDKTGGGTMRWMAPELLLAEDEEEETEVQSVAVRSKRTDVYALGMTMLEIITSAVPYLEYRNDQSIYGALYEKKPPKRPKELVGPDERAAQMWELLLSCWDHDPSARPSASSVFTSVFNLSKSTLEVPKDTPSFDIVTSTMSTQELFECLVRHGCTDLTSFLDDRQQYPVIASGGFGDVRRATLIDGTFVAIKTLRLTILLQDDDKGTKRAVREVYVWSRLRHPNIQELLGVIVFQGVLGMVSPWMAEGNLQQYIAKHPDAERYPMCAQVASGVSYLHSIDMVHGDLKANNVLVSNGGTLKINDFDHAILSSSTLGFSTTTRAGGGTLRWMAPELFQSDYDDGNEEGITVARSKPADVYALGMTMLEIITGAVPYAECRTDAGVYRAIFKKQPPRRPKELSQDDAQAASMWKLLLLCWDHDPSVRPEASSVLERVLKLESPVREDHGTLNVAHTQGGREEGSEQQPRLTIGGVGTEVEEPNAAGGGRSRSRPNRW